MTIVLQSLVDYMILAIKNILKYIIRIQRVVVAHNMTH
jgi:hypothetical protein